MSFGDLVNFDMDARGTESMGMQGEMGFQVSFSLASKLPVFNLALADMLDEVDDLLFVMDRHGRSLNFKARNGSGLSHFRPSGLTVQDMVPASTRQKLNHALEQISAGGKFAMFETMLTLPTKGTGWYEFRLIPTMDRQVVLFIWNINRYKAFSTTVTNFPISIEKMSEGWSRALYLRDLETEDHTRRVVTMSMRLAMRLGVPENEMIHIRRGGELHDIGKIAIPDHILLKPSALSGAEWNVMHKHPLIAVDLLEQIPNIEQAMAIPRSHHEKWDGSGYPDGLAGDNIPLFARIFTLADVYDALTSDRPYRLAWSKANTLAYILRESGRHFDPGIVPVFVKMLSNI